MKNEQKVQGFTRGRFQNKKSVIDVTHETQSPAHVSLAFPSPCKSERADVVGVPYTGLREVSSLACEPKAPLQQLGIVPSEHVIE